VELTPLRYFRAIAAAGHMTRAAESFGVTQPALSAVVRKLEAALGADLLHRTGKGVELTEAGRVFLAFADEAVLAADAGVKAVRELAGLERGSIRVGGGATAITYLLPPAFSAIRRQYPGLRFYVREAGSSAVAAAVLAGELDLGIVTEPLRLPGSAELMTMPLVEDELRLILPPRHRLSGRRAFRWADLSGESLVAFEGGTAVRDVIDRAMGDEGVEMTIVMELRSIESITRMVAAGIGVGFVSRFAVAGGGGLTCRDGRLTRRLAVVRRRDRVPSAAVGAFEREMLARVRTRS
jgi:LysR family cyn operon transcriptional activator